MDQLNTGYGSIPYSSSNDMKYFFGKAPGLKADINRHRQAERNLQERIAALEAKPVLDRMDEICLNTYRHLAYQLEVSKAEVTAKIGKK